MRVLQKILLLSLLLPKSTYSNYHNEKDVSLLEQQAFSQPPNSPSAIELWRKILTLSPKNSNARIQIGLQGMTSQHKQIQDEAFMLLEETFDRKKVNRVLPMPSYEGILLSSVIGRWRWERSEYERSQRFLQKAQDSMWQKEKRKDVCLALQLSTMLNAYPSSLEKKQLSADNFERGLKELLEMPNFLSDFEEEKLRHNVPGAANDPYVHCMCSLFNLELYYVENIAQLASLHFQAAEKVWPALVSDYFAVAENHQEPPRKQPDQCRDNASSKKIKLGIASGLLNVNTPVEADFKGILNRLDRSKFSITFIISNEKGTPISPLLSQPTHAEDTLILILKSPQDVTGDWLKTYHQQILNLELDVLLYLDVTMSSHMHRLAMTRLAPVTALTHGHPITSGFPPHIMDYYISWAAAELPLEQAKTYYSEELILLPGDRIHQYYDKSVDAVGKFSMTDGMSYGYMLQQERSDAFHIPDDNSNWYLCMQKPFKFQPEFDFMLCGILQSDPAARLILHEVPNSNHDILLKRLQQYESCDVHRIHFLPAQPHHKLLALYTVSDVILDSFPAAGCTTTREVLELNKVVITLPSILLGSRWSLGYYNIMSDGILTSAVVANDAQDYVQKAVALGTNLTLRNEMESRIRENIHKLFHKEQAVHGWEKLLSGITLKSCDGSSSEEMDDNRSNPIFIEL